MVERRPPRSRARARAASRSGAGIIGSSDVVSIQDAAFANGVLGHGLVRDDMHVGSVSHLGTVLVPALLALAEASRASGADFLAALVAGYEVGGKVGRMVMDSDVTKIFRPTGTVGPVAAAAAGAKLLGLDSEQTVTALALGANAAAGYNEWAATGGSEMFFHTGFAARSGVAAAQLAAGGAYASRDRDRRRSRVARGVSSRPRAADSRALRGSSRDPRRVLQARCPRATSRSPRRKPRSTIAQRKKLRANDIERVTVRVTRAAALYPGCDVSGPFEHVLQAKMSIHYNVAAALRHGDFDESNYVPQRNSDVLTIATKTRLEIDDELTKAFPAKQGAEVIVQTRAGDELRERVEDVVPSDSAASAGTLRRGCGGRARRTPSGAARASSSTGSSPSRTRRHSAARRDRLRPVRPTRRQGAQPARSP